MASTLRLNRKVFMIEKHSIRGQEVWIRVNPHPANRPNPNIIPTEYFTADYYLEEPTRGNIRSEVIHDESGAPRLFESPVEALSYTRRQLENILRP
jgi:hypothetical protein